LGGVIQATDRRPRRTYIICATPRSGSTLLCEALRGTGVAGNPEEHFEALRHSGLPRQPREYFPAIEDRSILDLLGRGRGGDRHPLWSAEDYRPYFEWALERGTTPNGVFGTKLMAGYLGDFVSLLRTIPEYRGLDLADLFPAAFPDVRFVRIVRANKLRQAISLWKALQTDAWKQEQAGAEAEPSFHLAAIEHLIRQMAADDARWDALFEVLGVKPLTIVYERFTDRYETTTRLLLEDLAIPIPKGLEFEERLQRQTNGTNSEWARRYGQLTIGADPDMAPWVAQPA
jgi:trehalose 2-sulfotransferase